MSTPCAPSAWFQKLTDGRLLTTHERWVQVVPKLALYHDYIDTLGKIGVRYKSVETELGMFLAKMMPAGTLGTCRKTAGVPTGCGQADEGRERSLAHWVFPPLSTCRESFDRLSGFDHPWSDPDDED